MAKYLVMLHRADIFKSFMANTTQLPTAVISSCIFTLALEGITANEQNDKASSDVLYDIFLHILMQVPAGLYLLHTSNFSTTEKMSLSDWLQRKNLPFGLQFCQIKLDSSIGIFKSNPYLVFIDSFEHIRDPGCPQYVADKIITDLILEDDEDFTKLRKHFFNIHLMKKKHPMKLDIPKNSSGSDK